MTNRKIPSDFDEGKFTVSVHKKYRPQITEIRLRELEKRNFSEFVCEAILFYEKYKNAMEKQWQMLMGNPDIEKAQTLPKWMMSGQPSFFPWMIGNPSMENEMPAGYGMYPTGIGNPVQHSTHASSAPIQAEEDNHPVEQKESAIYQQKNVDTETTQKENVHKEDIPKEDIQDSSNSNKDQDSIPTEPIIKINNKVVPHQEWRQKEDKSNKQKENNTSESPSQNKEESSSDADTLARYLFNA